MICTNPLGRAYSEFEGNLVWLEVKEIQVFKEDEDLYEATVSTDKNLHFQKGEEVLFKYGNVEDDKTGTAYFDGNNLPNRLRAQHYC